MQCSERVTLPLRNHIWKGQAGEFVGAGTGSSMDFQDHRNYVPGDDPRHINWQAYARSGNYTMKQYREEVRPSIDLILDISPSMFFDDKKSQRSCELFYLVHSIALQNGAQLTAHLILADQYIPISSESIRTTQWSKFIPEQLEQSQTNIPALEQIPLQHNSIRIFISDLLFEGDPSPLCHALSQRQGKPILLIPYLKSEANPHWQGNYDFIDAELKSKHAHKIDQSTLKKYIKLYQNHFQLWQQTAQKIQAPFARICADDELFNSLQAEAIQSKAFDISERK